MEGVFMNVILKIIGAKVDRNNQPGGRLPVEVGLCHMTIWIVG